jgi:AbrB family looped-hinge helix DNA binding protein
MEMNRKVGEKGQIVLPKDIRDYVGIKPGSKVSIEVEEKGIVIKLQKTGKDFVKDFLNVPKLKKPLTARQIKKTIEEQYDLP